MIERKVAGMIAAAGARSAAAGAEDAARLKLPLVRLRVDYTGFSTINAQRFGQKFVGRVANPHDMLLFHKAAARKAKVGTPLAGCHSTFPVMSLAHTSMYELPKVMN